MKIAADMHESEVCLACNYAHVCLSAAAIKGLREAWIGAFLGGEFEPTFERKRAQGE